MQTKGTIFSIKKFAIHDGPGIRSTIFFKGCPLSCLWCHNPEGISPEPEIMVFANRCLKDCRDCLGACPKKAIGKKGRLIVVDRSKCDGCGLCATVCPAEALQMAGRRVTVMDAVEQLSRDTAFYRSSGGGITCSGGEPLLQPLFLQALLRACRKQNLHTTIDTCGHAPFGDFAKILPLTNLFLYDLKIMDEGKHRRLTGVSNRLLIKNLQELSLLAPQLAIRIPLIPGCNDSAADLADLADFCATLPGRHPVHLLPYHRSGKNKRLGRVAPLAETCPPAPAAMQIAKEIFSKRKLTIKIGG
ncbi:MAG TPA: glycyl-radical enzyme activating protein [Patescibacteria group bacterium]|nr:glycyl-radical enzyme activating protein [Patescibacteria group bacterium]